MIIDNMTLIIIGLIVGAISIGFILIPFLKRKGYINQKQIDVAQKSIGVIGAVLDSVEFKDKNSKEAVDRILEFSTMAVNYVESTMRLDDNDIKKEEAVKLVSDMVKEVTGQDVTNNQLYVIDMGIELAVNKLPKTYDTK